MTARAVSTIPDMLGRAKAIGRELKRIADDPALHRLSRRAWVRCCVDLGPFADLGALLGAGARLLAQPYLASETMICARLLAEGQQDRPALLGHIFADGERFAAAYAERLALPMTVAEASAVCCYQAGIMRPDAAFGSLDDMLDLEMMLDPLLTELAGLDKSLITATRLCDVRWEPDPQGRTLPVLRVAGLIVPVGPSSARSLASQIAEQVQLAAREAERSEAA